MIGPELAHACQLDTALPCLLCQLVEKGGEGTPLIICAAEQAMVFKVLSLKQGVQFQYEAS